MALASACVIPAVWMSLDDKATAAPSAPVTPERQNSDALPQTAPAQIPTARPARPEPEPPPTTYDTDIAYLDNAFGIAELRGLAADGTTFIELPGQAQIELKLERRYAVHGREHLSASHAGLTSTFTRRGERFFATLATPTESYRMESDGSGSRLYPQRQLTARTIRHEKDFRHVD